ncbi:MAG: hypothetical protein QOI04_1771 [Verrucomicrobiota bacterium]|jgi:hypothetical protein
MKSQALNFAEWITAILLTVVVIVLLFVRAEYAGGLWRDECASVQLAEMPRIADVFQNFQRESFPAPFPLIIRAYGAMFGTSDAALRAFGFTVGLLLLAAVWTNALLVTGPPPLLALALLGLNTTFLISGTTMRGYGIGSVTILLVFGLVGRMLRHLTLSGVLAAFCASLLSVQLLLYNSVLLAAIALAAIIVSVMHRQLRAALTIAAISLVCAMSILPYLSPFWNESKSTIVLRSQVTLGWFWRPLGMAFGHPIQFTLALWGALLMTILAAIIARSFIIRPEKPAAPWDNLLFASLVVVISVIFYFAFLKIIGYLTREWHYLALLSVLAGSVDLLAASLCSINLVRTVRLSLVIAALIVMPIANWPKLKQRQTNVDLVAQKLEHLAQPSDLIVVNPWTIGVTFNRYYHGGTRWVTVPTMSDHRVHRFDLLKEKMMSPYPLADLGDIVGSTLRAGHRVWLVGGITLSQPHETTVPLAPAPNSAFGWNCDAYATVWSSQLGDFIQAHAARGEPIPVTTNMVVNEVEDEPLVAVEGWRQ